ncbi:hypothetical protein ROA7450_03783 [Roseovarius albus]|uniref:Uncharacterized protein n=1 Tax=Roseovarius albus TaxID=1247867 RepID=A0A1X7A692_9RHOB|nr:hypothetical protein [Roseovarius albus]SLN69868.1 hypothetical protein ROA7450_03783 [Roseovarius albus]
MLKIASVKEWQNFAVNLQPDTQLLADGKSQEALLKNTQTKSVWMTLDG